MDTNIRQGPQAANMKSGYPIAPTNSVERADYLSLLSNAAVQHIDGSSCYNGAVRAQDLLFCGDSSTLPLLQRLLRSCCICKQHV